MENIGQWFLGLGWGGIIISAILGAIISVLITKHFTSVRKPKWDGELIVLFDTGLSNVSDLKITFKDQKVTDLASTRIYFWNAGRTAINKEDINVPIYIAVPDECEIYSAEIVRSSKKYNNADCEISEDKKKVYIIFDKLERNQGIQLQVYNNCKDFDQISLHGEITETSLIRYAGIISRVRLNYFVSAIASIVGGMISVLSTLCILFSDNRYIGRRLWVYITSDPFLFLRQVVCFSLLCMFFCVIVGKLFIVIELKGKPPSEMGEEAKP